MSLGAWFGLFIGFASALQRQNNFFRRWYRLETSGKRRGDTLAIPVLGRDRQLKVCIESLAKAPRPKFGEQYREERVAVVLSCLTLAPQYWGGGLPSTFYARS